MENYRNEIWILPPVVLIHTKTMFEHFLLKYLQQKNVFWGCQIRSWKLTKIFWDRTLFAIFISANCQKNFIQKKFQKVYENFQEKKMKKCFPQKIYF